MAYNKFSNLQIEAEGSKVGAWGKGRRSKSKTLFVVYLSILYQISVWSSVCVSACMRCTSSGFYRRWEDQWLLFFSLFLLFFSFVSSLFRTDCVDHYVVVGALCSVVFFVFLLLSVNTTSVTIRIRSSIKKTEWNRKHIRCVDAIVWWCLVIWSALCWLLLS